MANHLEEMPLFPLDTVIFPYAQIQLHVFEPRYREMVRMCLAFDRPFGIVLIRNGREVGGPAEPYMVGTAVRIVSTHTYEDGGMDIRVMGERRFRIRDLDESNSYLVAKVEPVLEHNVEEEASELKTLIERTKEEFQYYIQKAFSRQEFEVQVVCSSDPTVLTFTIANLLPVENLTKQRLLETTSTTERCEDLLSILSLLDVPQEKTNVFKLSSNDLQDWVTPN